MLQLALAVGSILLANAPAIVEWLNETAKTWGKVGEEITAKLKGF